MLRLLFHGLALLSLLLALAIAILLPRSYTVCDTFDWYSENHASPNEIRTWLEIVSFPDCLSFNLGRQSAAPPGDYSARLKFESASVEQVSRSVGPGDSFLVRHGFGFSASGPTLARPVYQFVIEVPHWLVTLLFLLLPASWVQLKIRDMRRRRSRGLCPNCSYDLRAHNAGDKCPECGTVVPQPSIQ